MLFRSLADPNPVLFFEHKMLYRSVSGDVPTGYYTVEIGKATTMQLGKAASIITYGMGVHWAQKVTAELGADVEIIDLRSLQPLDYEAIEASVKKTHRALVLHEDTLTGGVGGEIAAYISEHLFQHLDAPVLRVASLDTPVPFEPTLEQNFMPLERLKKQLVKLLHY